MDGGKAGNRRKTAEGDAAEGIVVVDEVEALNLRESHAQVIDYVVCSVHLSLSCFKEVNQPGPGFGIPGSERVTS
ncbi:hypothetical protein HKBW3S44_01264 [Candidatus Hakubella thermalkaliphila]|uniref:Uncharacterized protein n=1 Tax=Candidatus Hakubella thermalkaliphila TaxID=2754717 RepID=A0A6V8PZ18_9ACTN|nr:hypothetical protein [Candidatus Hakubella thermalkaliphila]GFP24205.1 hypothetical protein HKBW3S09_01671 [Candidatus Hakubella thermalkaliphila]GFP37587.1 hypothetical protein HKBW3S44_01264 [Candidatus Hakubella thermalkaliphila]GFP41071.1 hypothetical protein HKBW3C_00197 [Candidatus Hakubella thermalkaliphila]